MSLSACRSLQALGRLRHARGGSALTEFALVGSALSLLVTGSGDAALAVWRLQQVHNAARAAVEYAARSGYNQSTMQTAATSATSLAVNASASSFCGCANSGGTSQATCGSTCPGGATTGTYATISVTYSYNPLFGVLFGNSTTVTLSSSMTTRTN